MPKVSRKIGRFSREKKGKNDMINRVRNNSNGWQAGKSNLYHSSKWRNLRIAILADEPFCRACARKGSKYIVASVIDHIKPYNSSMEFFDQCNLQPLCTSCHNRKSAYERKSLINK